MRKNSKDKKGQSIKRRLIVIPLIVVLIGVLAIAGTSSYLTRASLLKQMEENGMITSEQLVHRLDDSDDALTAINELLEEKITTIGKIIRLNSETISNDF